LCAQPARGSDPEQRLDGAAFIHGPVALGDVGERQFEVEDLARVDLAGEHEVDQMWQETPHRRRPAQQVLLREEQELALELHAVRHADKADGAAGTGRVDRLMHGFAGAHAFEHRIGADIAGELPDARDARIAALGDDVGGAIVERQILAGLVAAHGDDAPGPRRDLNDLLWFIAVAEQRSFTRVAAKLGTSQSTLSHTIKQLEQTLVWPKLEPVLAEYPDIRMEFSIDNGLRNIVEERFDAGVRLGESLEKDMIAVRIGPDWRLVAVASPAYLARHSAPRTPQDLVHHNCMNHRQGRSGGLYSWEFAKDGRELRVRVDGQLTFNTTVPMIDAAIAGHGIAYVPENFAADAIADGRLVQVLDEWSPFFPGYHLSYPSRRQLSPAMSVVVDALRHRPS